MTAPTTHDTRTVILGDEEMLALTEKYGYGIEDEDIKETSSNSYHWGLSKARSIYEPHVAKLEAEIAGLRAMADAPVQAIAVIAQRLDYQVQDAAMSTAVVEVCHWLSQVLPAAPTQGGGE